MTPERESSRSPSRIWFWAALLALAAAALVLQLDRRTAGASPPPEIGSLPAPSGLDEALAALFDPLRCITSSEAEKKVRELLDGRGLDNWTIKAVATDESECVGWSMSFIREFPNTVALIPVISPEVSAALGAIREDSYQQCLSKSELIQLLQSRLTALGQRAFDVRADGPLQVPLDREDEILKHVRSGCWVFSTYGRMDDRFVFFVGGQ